MSYRQFVSTLYASLFVLVTKQARSRVINTIPLDKDIGSKHLLTQTLQPLPSIILTLPFPLAPDLDHNLLHSLSKSE
jgi:hypothetical protein